MMAEKINNVKRARNSKTPLIATMTILVLILMTYMMLPTVIFLALSMLPTLSLLLVKTGSKYSFRYKFLSVGGLNFAGAMPFLFRLWFTDNSWGGAIALFMENGHFMIIYLTAFVGWLFFRFIPPVVLSFLEVSDQHRVANLREAQAKLVARWGDDVTLNASEPAKKKETERKN